MRCEAWGGHFTSYSLVVQNPYRGVRSGEDPLQYTNWLLLTLLRCEAWGGHLTSYTLVVQNPYQGVRSGEDPLQQTHWLLLNLLRCDARKESTGCYYHIPKCAVHYGGLTAYTMVVTTAPHPMCETRGEETLPLFCSWMHGH